MALKAYKHLTDGEVKIVEEGSAEEASLLADVVHGASYLQLTSTGHSQEVAAAQGTALWDDVSAEIGAPVSRSVHSDQWVNGQLACPPVPAPPVEVMEPLVVPAGVYVMVFSAVAAADSPTRLNIAITSDPTVTDSSWADPTPDVEIGEVKTTDGGFAWAFRFTEETTFVARAQAYNNVGDAILDAFDLVFMRLDA